MQQSWGAPKLCPSSWVMTLTCCQCGTTPLRLLPDLEVLNPALPMVTVLPQLRDTELSRPEEINHK